MKKIRITGKKIPTFWNKSLRLMKLTFLFLVVGLMQLSASVYSQSTKLSLDMRNAKVAEVLDAIESQSEFRFAYSPGYIDLNREVTVDIREKTIDESLKVVFAGTKVEFGVFDRHILLYPESLKPGAEPVISHATGAQQRTVSGAVTDEAGEPLPGVTVLVKGTTQGTVTNADGNYSLTNIPDNATLVFSFVGMLTQEVEVGDQSTINMTMVFDAIGIEEVVAVGYGTQRKVNLTGSIASVKAEELQNIPVSNLSNAMAGRAPGVQVIGNSGLAGATSSVRIRGSFGEPLYVIDGVIKDKASFDALDANEVESINFLKDAASASIYGSSAGNGVVLITTKEGETQKPQFEYKTSFSTSRPTQPVQSFTATEELEYVNNMMVTRGQPKPYGPEIFEYFEDKNYDINDLIWQNPSVQQHNLSVNGGSDRMTYYLTLGYHDEQGSYHNTDYTKFNFRSNVTAHITDRFKVNVNLSGNQRNYNRWYWPYDGAEDFNVSDWFRATFNWTRLYPFYVDAEGNPTNDPNDIPIKTAGGYHPPEIMLNGGYRDNTYRNLDGIIRFDLDLGEYVDGLSTSFQGNLNALDRNMKSFVLHNTWYIFQTSSSTNQFIPGPVDFTQTGKHNLSTGYENIQETTNLANSYQINWFLNYEKQFDQHDISAMAVYEQAGSNGKYLFGRAEDLLSSSIDQIFNASGDTERRWFSGNESQFARASWIGRVNYSYGLKYILEFSFRYDGNYKFAPDKQWGFFPSVSAGWRLSEESFMEDLDWLSNLKLRGSYGTTGSDSDIGAWRWTNIYQKTTGYIFGNSLQDGLRPGAMPNPDITWSTVTLWDVGLEYGVIDNKLRGEFDVWSKTESDILGNRSGSTPTTLGANLPAVNYAQRSWDGFEVSASWNNRAGELNYQVYANMGYAIDQWDIVDEPESYTDGTYEDNWRSAIGKPANRVGGYISRGIIRTQEELDAIPEGFTQFGREPILGTILFEDIRGENYSEGADGKIDGNDWTYLSDNGAPRINYGLGINLEWKGLAVNTHLQGVGAYDRMVRNRNSWGVFQVDKPYFEIWADNYWTPETPDAKYPRVAGNWLQPEYGGGASSFWIRDGSFLRLKNLNIAYTLPPQWYQKLGVNKVQLFANGTNLFVLTQFKEYDPEQETLDSYPLMKTFTGGLTVNF
jgi:TonB-dependent starch-binding outer membrane protein SusC